MIAIFSPALGTQLPCGKSYILAMHMRQSGIPLPGRGSLIIMIFTFTCQTESGLYSSRIHDLTKQTPPAEFGFHFHG